MNEPFRVFGPSFVPGALALFEDKLGAAVMDVAWGEHGDPGMSRVVVVPREEGPAECERSVDVIEASRKAEVVFQRLELGFGEGVVVADPGPAEGAGDAEVGEQLRGAFGDQSPTAGNTRGSPLRPDPRGTGANRATHRPKRPAYCRARQGLGRNPCNEKSEGISPHSRPESRKLAQCLTRDLGGRVVTESFPARQEKTKRFPYPALISTPYYDENTPL